MLPPEIRVSDKSIFYSGGYPFFLKNRPRPPIYSTTGPLTTRICGVVIPFGSHGVDIGAYI